MDKIHINQRDQTMLRWEIVPAGGKITKVGPGSFLSILLNKDEMNWLFTNLAAQGNKPLPKPRKHVCGEE